MPYLSPLTIIPPLSVPPRTAAEILGSTESSLEKDRAIGHLGFPYIKAGKRIFYRICDLDEWLAANRKKPSKRGICHD